MALKNREEAGKKPPFIFFVLVRGRAAAEAGRLAAQTNLGGFG